MPPEQQKYHDIEWLRHQYIELNRSAPDIAKECGVIVQTIEAILIQNKIYKTLPYDELKQQLPKDVLYDLYVSQGIGLMTIAKNYNHVGRSTMLRLMHEYGIPIAQYGEQLRKHWQNPQFRNKMSMIRKELWNDPIYREHTMAHVLDKDAVRNSAIKHSARVQGVSVEEWTGFLTNANIRIRGSSEYKQWRNSVFERDNYTCQCCGARSKAGAAVTLQAHHLEPFSTNKDRRFDVTNGITLCNECHDSRKIGSFHNLYGTVNNTADQYYEYVDRVQSAIAHEAS